MSQLISILMMSLQVGSILGHLACIVLDEVPTESVCLADHISRRISEYLP